MTMSPLTPVALLKRWACRKKQKQSAVLFIKVAPGEQLLVSEAKMAKCHLPLCTAGVEQALNKATVRGCLLAEAFENSILAGTTS